MQGLITEPVIDRWLRFPQSIWMITHDEIRDELVRQLDDGRIIAADVARVLGVASPRITEIKKGARKIQQSEMPVLANLLKMEDGGREADGRPYGQAFGQGRTKREVADQQPTRSADAGETAQLLRLDLSLPMGPGALVDDYVEEEPIEIDLGYLRGFTHTPPHRLRLARGVGDSMFPTLLPNDEVLIDTTQNQLLHSDRIYAASINGGAAIKRLRPIEGGKRVLVISDNKTLDPYPVDAREVAIWGRVIRFARDL